LVRAKIIQRIEITVGLEDRDHPIFDWESTPLVFGDLVKLCNEKPFEFGWCVTH
jgi:hypothetical protein